MDGPPSTPNADANDDAGGYDGAPDDGTAGEYDDATAGYRDTAGDGERRDETRRGDYDDPIGDLLPYASVDSNWWYWIAAVPAFFAVSTVGGVFFFFGFFLDFFLTGGLLSVVGALVFGGFAALAGLVLSVLFPIAVYVDARALCDSPASEWSPDPLLYGLVALAGVVVTAFTVSVPLAIYYLYRRHGAVGTP